VPHGKTGQAGTVSIGAGAFDAKLRRWRVNPTMRTVDDTGAGEFADSILPLRLGWVFECEGIHHAGLAPPSSASMIGDEVAIIAKVAAGDTTPAFSGTGMVIEAEINSPYDDVATFSLRAVCSTGALPANV
jgi:hypothetical protein